MNALRLVPLPVDGERAALARWPTLGEARGELLVPVPDDSHFIGRLIRVFRDAGLRAQVGCDAPPREGTERLRGARIPDKIFFLGTVDRRILEFTRILTGVEPQEFRQEAVSGRSALVLWSGQDSLSNALKELGSAGLSVGIIPAHNSTEARFTVAKALLIGSDRARGEFYWARPGCTAVSTLGRDPRGRGDVLVFSGHSNALDAQIGDEYIMCSRPPGAHSDGPLPCYVNGRCFRTQPETDRSSKLLRATEFRSRLIVATGCNFASTGKLNSTASRSLLGSLLSGPARAVIASRIVLDASICIDLAALSLVVAGADLGTIVSTLNAALCSRHSHHRLRPPFVLFGNPCYTLEGWSVERIDLTDPTIRAVSIKKEDQRSGLCMATISRRQTSRLELSQIMKLQGRPVYTVIMPVDDDRSELFSVFGPVSSVAKTADVTAECDGHRGAAPRQARLARQAAHQLCFWRLVLPSYEHQLASKGSPHSAVRRAQEAIIELHPMFVAAQRATGASSVGDIQEVTQTPHPSTAVAFEICTGLLLDATVEICCSIGSLLFLGWRALYLAHCAKEMRQPCSCGSRTVIGRCFTSLGGVAPRRRMYECEVCGPIGEDDGSITLDVRSAEQVEAGSMLSVHVSVRALGGRRPEGQACCVLECWYHEANVVGRNMILDHASSQATSELPVPLHIVPGLYVLAVLAVIDGALCIRRHSLRVTARRER